MTRRERHSHEQTAGPVTTSNSPHLLYVAWGYPPCRGGGVYRALATANAFAENGWRVTVLTANRETFTMGTGIDSTLEAQIHPSIAVVRVPFTSGAYQTDIREWSPLRAYAPELWNGYRALKDRRSFPEATYGGWRTPLEEAALRIHRANPVDLTIGTANPHVDFAPGHRLHRDFGVPYIIDYRDAWQLDVFSGKRLSAPGSAVDRWEHDLVENAHEIWFVNEPIRAWHAEYYPKQAERMHVVANGYDATMTQFSPEVRPDREAGIVLGYIGTISSADAGTVRRMGPRPKTVSPARRVSDRHLRLPGPLRHPERSHPRIARRVPRAGHPLPRTGRQITDRRHLQLLRRPPPRAGHGQVCDKREGLRIRGDGPAYRIHPRPR
jgi:glycosyltransferase involved in cell wall biosynthesis